MNNVELNSLCDNIIDEVEPVKAVDPVKPKVKRLLQSTNDDYPDTEPGKGRVWWHTAKGWRATTIKQATHYAKTDKAILRQGYDVKAFRKIVPAETPEPKVSIPIPEPEIIIPEPDVTPTPEVEIPEPVATEPNIIEEPDESSVYDFI